MSRLDILSFALASLLTVPAVAADTPADLVQKLGHSEFRVREAAAAALVRLGSSALQALTEGAKSPDAEIAEKCRKLLPQAEAVDRAEGLAALLRDSKVPPSKRLPGVESFLKVTGDTKDARELYADLVREHPDEMVARERDQRAAGDLFYRYGVDLNDRYQKAQMAVKLGKSKSEGTVTTPTDLALFLVFAADPRVNQAPRHYVYQQMLLFSPNVRSVLTDGDRSPAMRDLFFHWLLNEPIDPYQRTGFGLVTEFKVPWFLPRMAQLITDKATPAKTRALAMIALLQGGTKEHLPLLTPFLDDKTEVNVTNLRPRVFHTQVRDVAMGMSVRLSGERAEDFGLGDRRFGFGPGARGVPGSMYYYGFTEDEAREAAHQKWREWVRKNPAVAGAEPAKK